MSYSDMYNSFIFYVTFSAVCTQECLPKSSEIIAVLMCAAAAEIIMMLNRV